MQTIFRMFFWSLASLAIGGLLILADPRLWCVGLMFWVVTMVSCIYRGAYPKEQKGGE